MQYQLQRSKRARSIRIEITPQAEVIVTAPNLVPNFFIERFVNSKADWITRHLGRIKHNQVILEKNEILLFGQKYQLIFDHQAPQVGVFLQQQTVIVQNLTAKSSSALKQQLERFLKNTAQKYIVIRCQTLAKKMGIQYRAITLRQQKSRWGSCSSQGNLNFNWRLIHYPVEIIDYVIIHELAHRKEMNHSARFWAIVQTYDANYQTHRRELQKKRYNEGL